MACCANKYSYATVGGGDANTASAKSVVCLQSMCPLIVVFVNVCVVRFVFFLRCGAVSRHGTALRLSTRP